MSDEKAPSSVLTTKHGDDDTINGNDGQQKDTQEESNAKSQDVSFKSRDDGEDSMDVEEVVEHEEKKQYETVVDVMTPTTNPTPSPTASAAVTTTIENIEEPSALNNEMNSNDVVMGSLDENDEKKEESSSKISDEHTKNSTPPPPHASAEEGTSTDANNIENDTMTNDEINVTSSIVTSSNPIDNDNQEHNNNDDNEKENISIDSPNEESTISTTTTGNTSTSITKPLTAATELAINTTNNSNPTTTNSTMKPATITPPPTQPPKKPKSGYFIFMEEHRPSLKSQFPNEPIGAIAKRIGKLWSELEPAQKQHYQDLAKKEKELYTIQLNQYHKQHGKEVNGKEQKKGTQGSKDVIKVTSQTCIIPPSKIKKTCKLDPEVKSLSKEAILCITKAAEHFTISLGKGAVGMAQVQGRKTLNIEDVLDVCSVKECFYFLNSDIKDLKVELLNKKRKELSGGSEKNSTANASNGSSGKKAKRSKTRVTGVKPLTSYFKK